MHKNTGKYLFTFISIFLYFCIDFSIILRYNIAVLRNTENKTNNIERK